MLPSLRTLWVVLFLALARPAWSASWDAERILQGRDPEAAEAFLGDAAGQARLRAGDSERYRAVFMQAADLKSLADLLRGEGGSATFRDALRSRAGCGFCQEPAALVAWAGTLVPALDAERLKYLRRAVYEWDTLPSALRARLAAGGESEAGWAAMPLPLRSTKIEPWLQETLAAFLKELPRTKAELKDLYDRSDDFIVLLRRDERIRLTDRTDALESSLDGLEKARERASAFLDPKIRETLKQAEAASDLETRLALLSALFDGLGLRDDSVTVAAPPRAGQVFDASSRRVTADLLRGGLMATIAGTWAGDELTEFYRTHPLDLRIARTDESGTVGWYEDGVMSFNEAYIVMLLKVKGRDVRDLQADPALLANLTADLAPLFVHEATHQRQQAWREERGLPKVWEQNSELEAKQTEALFTLEKSSRDPVFRATLERDALTPGPARSALREAEQLRDLGPAAYRDKVRVQNYPYVPSLEGGIHRVAAYPHKLDGIVAAELARRAALPAAEAALLEEGPTALGEHEGPDGYQRELVKLATPVLRGVREHFGKTLDSSADAYAAYRERQRLVDERTEVRLNELLSNGPAKRRAPEVPSPASR